MPSTAAYLMLSGTLFAVGLVGVVIRRNMITVLMCIELMLNAVNINLIAFARFRGDIVGMVFSVFTICITVAEAALGLAIVKRTREVPNRNAEAVGMALYSDYLVPFEVASLFLLLAMVGAIVIGKRELSAEEE